MSYYREQLNDFIKDIPALPAMSSVLDIGGAQSPIEGRLKDSEATKYTILDLKKPHQGHFPDIQCDLNEGYFGDSKEFFDFLFCFEVMEYIWNPVKALKTMRWFTKEGGTLYISFPFVYGVHPPEGEDCLRYTPDGAEKILRNCGWEIVEHDYRYGNPLLQKFYECDKMRIRKNYDHSITGSIIKARAV